MKRSAPRSRIATWPALLLLLLPPLLALQSACDETVSPQTDGGGPVTDGTTPATDGPTSGDAKVTPPDGGSDAPAVGDAAPPVTGIAGLVDWTLAGIPGGIPAIAGPVVDVTTVGASCDGTSDDQPAIQAAIDGASDPTVILLPARTCRIESPLVLESGVVLRGRGSDQTRLDCQTTEGCLGAAGSPAGGYVSITGGLQQGSTQLQVADASGFSQGQGAEIRQQDIVPPSADWGAVAVGQMAHVVAIQGNTLTIEPPLHLDYDAGKSPEIRPIDFVERVGIEDLHLRRIDAGGSSASNIGFRRVAHAWVRRVESDFTEKYHLGVGESLQLEIRESYFHHAKSKGDGGQGYGVSFGRYVTSALVENNIFVETRHAMIVQIGVNGCVFGYNYAEKNYSDDGWDKTYITLHGHYPWMNLFEGNIVGYVGVDDVWGASGPGNTFFRNKVLGTDKHQDFGEFRGILLEQYHGTQYLVGNQVAGEGIYGDLSDVLLHGNDENGDVSWDPSLPQSLPASYYRGAKPAFYGALDWPSVGADIPFGQSTNPALQRWQASTPVPQP